jgi:hypothetical protein
LASTTALPPRLIAATPAHGLAGLLPLFFAQLAVAVGIEFLQEPLPEFRITARPVGGFFLCLDNTSPSDGYHQYRQGIQQGSHGSSP